MSYKYEIGIGKAFAKALNQGKMIDYGLIRELDTVYEKAKAFDKVTKLYEQKQDMYSNEFVEELGYILKEYEEDTDND